MLHHRGDVLQVLEVVYIDRPKLHNLIINLKSLDRERREMSICILQRQVISQVITQEHHPSPSHGETDGLQHFSHSGK